MPSIKNATWGPLTVELLRGKMILLSPRGSDTITDEEFHSNGFQQLFRAKKIYVLPQSAARKVKVTR